MYSLLGGGLVTDNNRLYWLGNEDMSLNKHTIRICGEITLGYYGGNSDSGAYKNEDGALMLCSSDNACDLPCYLMHMQQAKVLT